MKTVIINPNVTVSQAMKKLVAAGEKCLVVVNEENKLLGTLSDGDLRRAILKGHQLSDSIHELYYDSPRYLFENEFNLKEVEDLFLIEKFDLIPVINKNRVVIDILFVNSIKEIKSRLQYLRLDVPVVIMAGGKGTRMKPFTNILPKPLIPIGGKTMIENIIDMFLKVGCEEFYLTVNYKASILKAYFKELKPSYSLKFVQEKEPLGTGGSLRFLNGEIKKPFFVTNCDIMINTTLESFYDFHIKGNFDISLVAATKEFIIPYGSCELDEKGYLSHINEKPKYNFLINTGLYVLNPDVLSLIPKNKFYHITHLIEDLKNRGKKIGVFPVDDDCWIDVGQWNEYSQALDKIKLN